MDLRVTVQIAKKTTTLRAMGKHSMVPSRKGTSFGFCCKKMALAMVFKIDSGLETGGMMVI